MANTFDFETALKQLQSGQALTGELVAMDMGEEFELSKDQVESLLDALLLDNSLNS